jgi:uncharacterized protein YggE
MHIDRFLTLPRSNSTCSAGIAENQITISSISVQTLHSRSSEGTETSEITGYSLHQQLEASSNEVEKIAKIAREATELINQAY